MSNQASDKTTIVTGFFSKGKFEKDNENQQIQCGLSTSDHYSMVTSDDRPISAVLTPKNVPAILYVKSDLRTCGICFNRSAE